jgi:alpha-L-rhamnosidase
MNSFNHYAYGSVGDWLYQFVAGIQVDPALPGYQHILFKPQPGGGLTAARAAYESLYGRVVSDWHMQDGRFTWQVILPPNSLATVWLPALPEQVARESGLPLDQAQGVSVERQEATCRVLSLQSGEYHFLVD